MVTPLPRLVVAALRGGSGKTTLTLGVIRALKASGLTVAPFKKGPDYIDPFWLGAAAESTCRNLDPFLLGDHQILRSFGHYARGFDVAVVEGNRGLFDGLDAAGSYSTAELAKILKSPVLLLVDCSMASRTVAAAVLGCQRFDSALNLAGVVFNLVGNFRQEGVIRQAIVEATGLPVLGALPRLKLNMPERHMGLLPPQEHARVSEALDKVAASVAAHVDLEGLLRLMRAAPAWSHPGPPEGLIPDPAPASGPMVGVVRDPAFGFYYPENLEALANYGARLVFCSALSDSALPKVNALYLGGGFPETHAEPLAANRSFLASVAAAAEAGLPIYAECGGMMYLGRHIVAGGRAWPMAGIFPLDFVMREKPQGHGYTICRVTGENPFLPLGCEFRAHEFHYSRASLLEGQGYRMVFEVLRGQALRGQGGGILYKNTLGTYHHVHALGLKEWAPGFLAAASRPRS
jgi:cobyrinic acid a,c-diamide synthase